MSSKEELKRDPNDSGDDNIDDDYDDDDDQNNNLLRERRTERLVTPVSILSKLLHVLFLIC